VLRSRQLCIRSQLWMLCVSLNGELGTQDFHVLRHSCCGAILMIMTITFLGPREAPSHQTNVFLWTGTPTYSSKQGILQGLQDNQGLSVLCSKFCFPAPMFRTWVQLSGPLEPLIQHQYYSWFPRYQQTAVVLTKWF